MPLVDMVVMVMVQLLLGSTPPFVGARNDVAEVGRGAVMGKREGNENQFHYPQRG